MVVVHILDYVAGNVRSLANAVERVGHTPRWVQTPGEVHQAEVSWHYLPVFNMLPN